MQKLTHQDLYSLEQYALLRNNFRSRVMASKKARRVAIGENAALYFEDKLTIQYQVQEMLRIERIFEPEGIEEELAVYNPLIPDGSNWKATFMLEYGNIAERRVALARLVGIEHKVYVQVAGFEPVYAICNEDLERSTPDKTSAVHFMRFEFTPSMITAIKDNSTVNVGINHEEYNINRQLTVDELTALRQDLT
ncbi:hypothetical protein TI04_04110 [Achromatium sp. WMS2]|nr:hypothetical protein TI04_04110 [Achromatium sp. WMS2]